MNDNSAYGRVIETLRIQAGARLHEVQNAAGSKLTRKSEQRFAKAWDEFGQISGLLSGYVFGLKSTLPPERFKQVLRDAGVDELELKALLNIAAEFTRPLKRAKGK